MKKLSTLYKKDPADLGRVINEINPENEWVFKSGIPTRKFDGTACAVINRKLYKRYDAKRKKKDGMFKVIPEGAIPCQEPDEITGHHPHWIVCERDDPAHKWHFDAWDIWVKTPEDGTYELCGPKVQGNPENLDNHQLIKHGCEVLDITDFSFEALKSYLEVTDIEGIVFHSKEDERMCKIRKSDFGIRR